MEVTKERRNIVFSILFSIIFLLCFSIIVYGNEVKIQNNSFFEQQDYNRMKNDRKVLLNNEIHTWYPEGFKEIGYLNAINKTYNEFDLFMNNNCGCLINSKTNKKIDIYEFNNQYYLK